MAAGVAMHRDAAPRTWISRGASWLGWPHDNSARPQGELYRAASATVMKACALEEELPPLHRLIKE